MIYDLLGWIFLGIAFIGYGGVIYSVGWAHGFKAAGVPWPPDPPRIGGE